MPIQTRILVLPLGLGLGLIGACNPSKTIVNDDHCAANGGDVYCAEQFTDKPYCQLSECNGQDSPKWGCVAEQPSAECWAECGVNIEYVDGNAQQGELIPCDGTDSGTDSTTTSSTETTDATETGPMLCTGPQDCMDAALPFCNMDGACVACDGMPEPDVACAEADAELPVCFASECVACAEGKVDACVGTTPICDTALNVCEGCSDHGQCPDSACNLAEGNCMDPSVVVHVDGDEPCAGADGSEAMPYCSIAAALGAAGAEVVIVLHKLDNDNPYVQANTIAVDVVMFLASGEQTRIQGSGGSAALTVSASGSLFLQGVGIQGGPSTGITINGGQTWIEESLITANAAQGVSLNGGTAVIERSRIVNNTGGGIVVDGGGMLMLENSFVGGNVNDVAAVDVVDGDAEISYSTLAAGAKILVDPTALSCAMSGVTVRNSILVSPAIEPAVVCNGASIESSVLEDTTDFPDNTEAAFSANWFTAYASGDFHLSAMHPAAIDTAAIWVSGDPATDIDGNARPTTNGTSDFAGADRIP